MRILSPFGPVAGLLWVTSQGAETSKPTRTQLIYFTNKLKTNDCTADGTKRQISEINLHREFISTAGDWQAQQQLFAIQITNLLPYKCTLYRILLYYYTAYSTIT